MATLKKAVKSVASATTPVKAKASTTSNSAVDAYMAKTPTKTKKVIKIKKAVVDTKNLKDTVTKIVESKREVKYIYPDGMVDQLKRKAYRSECRTKEKSFLKKIEDAKRLKQDTAKIDKEYRAFRKATYLVP